MPFSWFKRKSQKIKAYNHREVSKKDPFLSTEIWEVLTVFTAILSIASAIIWVGTSTPAEVAREFLLIDWNKSQIYNSYEKVSIIPKKYEYILEKGNNLKDYDSILKIDVNHQEYEKIVSQIEVEERNLDNLLNDIKSTQTRLKKDSQVEDLSTEYKNYLIAIKVFYERVFYTNKEVIEIQKNVQMIVKKNKLNVEKDLKDLRQKINSLKENGYIKTEWLVNLENWTNQIYDLSNNQIEKEDLAQIVKSYEAIFEDPLDYQKINTQVKKSELTLLSSFSNTERWQKEYANSSKDPELIKNLTKIGDE